MDSTGEGEAVADTTMITTFMSWLLSPEGRSLPLRLSGLFIRLFLSVFLLASPAEGSHLLSYIMPHSSHPHPTPSDALAGCRLLEIDR
jgi:hypothetical protein